MGSKLFHRISSQTGVFMLLALPSCTVTSYRRHGVSSRREINSLFSTMFGLNTKEKHRSCVKVGLERAVSKRTRKVGCWTHLLWSGFCPAPPPLRDRVCVNACNHGGDAFMHLPAWRPSEAVGKQGSCG